MHCPNCEQGLSYISMDNQNILHCSHCGGTFFEENSLNRISFTTAQTLSADRESEDISGKQKRCPKDQTLLVNMSRGESVPESVTLLKCTVCNGIFVFPEDLLRFKAAQTAKLEYLRTWKLPLPSLRAVAVFTTAILVVGGILVSNLRLQNLPISGTRARDIVTKVNVTTSGRFLLVSFRTSVPMRSEIIFESTSKKEIIKKVSSDLTQLHYITTSDIDTHYYSTYRIQLTDSNGNQSVTDSTSLFSSP